MQADGESPDPRKLCGEVVDEGGVTEIKFAEEGKQYGEQAAENQKGCRIGKENTPALTDAH